MKMSKTEADRLALAQMLNEDLQNEYKHLHFYLRSAVLIQGPHREELGEWFLKEAASELKHCEEFSRKIVGLNGVPTMSINDYPYYLTNVKDILNAVFDMESEVVETYCNRLKQCEEIGGVDGTVIGLFYEDQIMDSREAVDHVKEMLRGL